MREELSMGQSLVRKAGFKHINRDEDIFIHRDNPFITYKKGGENSADNGAEEEISIRSMMGIIKRSTRRLTLLRCQLIY